MSTQPPALIVQPEKDILFDPFEKQEEFLQACFSGLYSFILYGGAIRGGKTFSILGLFILLCKIYPGSRWAIIRKDLPTIESNLYPVWYKIRPTNFLKDPSHDPHGRTHISTFKNGSKIIFFPESVKTDKEMNRWKGLEVNGFGFEEINECQKQTLYKAFERAGSYIIKGAKVQPKPLVVASCNPSWGWVKDLIYLPHKNGTLKPGWLYIQSRIYDNKRLLQQQPDYLPSLKANLNHYEYEVYVEGNWDVQLKTGNEFLSGFELDKHLRPVTITPGLPFHVSMDNNVYPHIAITVWQLIKTPAGYIIRQVAELPVKPPGNSAGAAADYIIKFLQAQENKERVHLYGDWSTKNTNTIDPQGRSFFQIIDEKIKTAGFHTQDNMMPHASPSSIADFINAIFAGEIKGLSIEIGEHCKDSVNDYIETKKDKNGNIEKVNVLATSTAPAHQKFGHLTDTFKDFIVQAFRAEYNAYLSRHSAILPGGINQYSRPALNKFVG
jgi:hypothetical protein